MHGPISAAEKRGVGRLDIWIAPVMPIPLERWTPKLAIGLDHVLRHLFHWPSCENCIDPSQDMCPVVVVKERAIG
jgi:hypothetical protein